MSYRIEPCRLAHLRVLARTMRAEDRAEVEDAGFLPRHALIGLWRLTPDPKVVLVDGEVAAAWGDRGGVLSPEGLLWLLTAPPIERVPLAFFREARRFIAERLEVRSVLRSGVAEGYPRALRFYAMLGFRIGEPYPVGRRGALQREITMGRQA